MYAELYEHKKHYDAVSAWFTGHGQEALPPALLGLGVVVKSDDGIPLAAAFGYLDRISVLGLVEFAIANPANSSFTSYRSLQVAIEGITHMLKKAGAGVVMSFFRHPGLHRILAKQKWIKNEPDIVSYIKVFGEEQ